MATWFYSVDGKPKYYQDGKYIYSAQDNSCALYESNGWWYQMNGGQPAYYIREKWVYPVDGKPAYYTTEP